MGRPRSSEKAVRKKYALLATCGMTPQIITETLWAMNQKGQMPITVRIVTTETGRKLCVKALLGDDKSGKYYDLLKDQGIDEAAVDFSIDDILVPTITKEGGKEAISFIRTEEEIRFFLELCMNEAFKLTSQINTEVVFLVAGGTANMCSCLTIAAQFYGKIKGVSGRKADHLYPVSDRICQVYVEPREMENRDYFYPSDDSSRVNLIELPLLSVRNKFMSRDFDESASYYELLTSVANRNRKLVLHTQDYVVEWGGVKCKLEKLHFVIFYFICTNKEVVILPEINKDRDGERCVDASIDASNVEKIEGIKAYYRTRLGKDDIVLNFAIIKSAVSRIREDFTFFFGPNHIIRDTEPRILSTVNKNGTPDNHKYYGFSVDIHKDNIFVI